VVVDAGVAVIVGAVVLIFVASLAMSGPCVRRSCDIAQSWDQFGAILGHLGAIFGPSWGILGPSWGHLGASWDHLGHPVAEHAPSWASVSLH